MIIDVHTHIGFNEVIDASAKDLLASLRRAKISKAFVLGGHINACPIPKLIQELEPHKGLLYAIGGISPLEPTTFSLEQLEQWLANGQLHGLKFYPGYEYFYPYENVVQPYLKLLVKYGKPAIFHSGDTFSRVHAAKLKYAQPLHIDDIATDNPELKIIIAHMSYPWVIDAAEVCYKNKNVVADCSGFVYGKFTPSSRSHFAEIVKQFLRVAGSSEKLLFGTDWPISDQQSYVRVVRSIVGKDAGKIFYENAAQLFGIK